jgi:ligand-binding sensor domain-containing protein
MGTPGGVTTYDGVKFQKYKYGNGLAESGVWSIYKDSRGLLWFGHLDGSISRWDGNKFENIQGGIIFKDVVYSFCENEKGELWITSYGSGAALISNPAAPLNNLKYENYKGNRLGDRVYGCYRLSDHKNYFITDAGVKVFNVCKKIFENFYIDGMPRFFPITTLFEDKNKNLWLGTMHGGLYKYNRISGHFKIYDIRDGLSSNFITCIAEDNHDNIWIGTESGITKIHDNKLTIYNQTNGFQGGMVLCITIDAEENILFGTFENGLSIYKGDFLIFSEPYNIPDKQIYSILEDSNKKIWFGTDNGISIFDPNHAGKNHPEWIKGAIDKPSKIRFIKEDKQKNIWIGTYNNGLFEYFSKTGKFESNFDIFSTLPPANKQITALGIDNNGSLWIGANDCLLNYNTTTGQIHGYSQYDGLSGNIITAIHIGANNIKYIGSQGRGITVFKDTLTLLSKRFPLLGNTTPTCITSDSTGNIG